MTIRQRLRHALLTGPRAVDDLALELDAKPNTITQALLRDEQAAAKGKVRQFIKLPDARIGLYAERTS